MRVIAMAEVWVLTILGIMFCCGAGLMLICAVVINSLMPMANDGKEGGDNKHDE